MKKLVEKERKLKSKGESPVDEILVWCILTFKINTNRRILFSLYLQFKHFHLNILLNVTILLTQFLVSLAKHRYSCHITQEGSVA